MAEQIDIKLNFDDTELIKGLSDIQRGLKKVDTQAKQTGQAQQESFNKATARVKTTASGVDRLANSFSGAASKIANVAGVLGVAFSAVTIGQQVGRAAQLAISVEQTKVAFETFLGSAEAARDVLAELNEFSLATPFEPSQVIEAGQSLLAFGFEASEITEQLNRIGNVSAGVNTNFNELATIFGKARISGRLFADDINQLTDRGIPIISELADQFDVAEDKVKGLVESGQVEFSNLERAFVNLTSEGGKFFGLIEKQSQTVGGRLSTLRGNVNAVFAAFGERLLPAIGANVEALNRFVSRAREFVQIPVSEKLEEERVTLNALVLQITDANIEEGKRLSLINQLNAEFPTFLDGLDAQTVSNKQLSDRLSEVNKELINNIIIQQQKEKIDKAAARVSEERQDRAKAELEINKALTTANESLTKKVDISTGSLQDRVEAVRAALESEARFTESVRDGIKTGLNPQFDQLVKLERATNQLRGATNREAAATETVLDLEKERNAILEQLNISTDENTEGTDDNAKATERQTAAVVDNNKAQKERERLLKELEKLTRDLTEAATDARIEGEEDARKQSKLILDAQLAEIEALKQTIETKAAELGKEVDITDDINALKAQAEAEHQARITEIIVDEFKIRAAEIEKQAEQDAENAAFVQAQQLQQLETQKQINESEVKLLTASTDERLTLEQFKQKRLLEIQLDFQRQRLELLASEFGPDSKEVELLKTQIQVIESELGKIGEGETGKDIFGNLAGKLADSLGLDDAEFNKLVDGVKNLFGEVFNAVEATTAAAIEQNNKLIESIDERIETTEAAFNRELELAQLGLANSVDLKKQELDALNEERAKAAEQAEQLAAQERRIDTIQQTVSLVTASANIFQSLSALGPVGVALAVATIATMFGGFIAAKARANQLTAQLAEGGQIQGRPHSAGGHRIEGTNLEVEGGEWVVNKADSNEHSNFIKRLNSGEFKGLDLNAVMDGRLIQKGNIGRRIQESEADINQAQEKARIEAQNRQIAESIDNQTGEIVNAIKSQPIVISTDDGYIIKTEINGRKYTRRVRL